jgi:hypothetical protein
VRNIKKNIEQHAMPKHVSALEMLKGGMTIS